MPPLVMTVQGHAVIPRTAERAVLDIEISSSGTSRQWVSEEVTTSAKHLQTLLRSMSPADSSDEAKQSAALAHWSMTSLTTTSRTPIDNHGNPLKDAERIYSAVTAFDIRVRDFDKLGPFATRLSTFQHLKIKTIEWTLTEPTKKTFESELRIMAAKDAQQRARDYAQALGLTTVRPIELDEQPASYVHGRIMQSQRRMKQTARRGGIFGASVAALSGSEHEDEQNFEDVFFQPEEVRMQASVSMKFESE